MSWTTKWKTALDQGLGAGMVAVFGLPWDGGSSFLPGAALAPPRIREAWHSDAGNPYSESGARIAPGEALRDLGDVDLAGLPATAARGRIEEAAAAILERGACPLALGGDHSVTYPLVRAQARLNGPVDILHLDAHADLYDELGGDRYSHACPFARILDEGLARRLVQVGIRTLTPEQRQRAARHGVEIIDMRAFTADLELAFEHPFYLSVDLDVLDPAFAPGVSHLEPGGLSVREVLGLLHGLEGELLGADIVELNPHRDPGARTAAVAAKLLKEIAALWV